MLKKTVELAKEKKKIEKTTEIKQIANSHLEETNNAQTLRQALEIFIQAKERLNYNSTKNDVEKFQKIKSELATYLFDDLNEKVANIPALREKFPQTLFEKIYSLEKLDSDTIQEIRKLRDNRKVYPWFERKAIVNAITISLINFKIFDRQKANLLLDFLNDFEDNVWENALTGLLISLIFHQNKWEKWQDLKQRLELLKNIPKVQSGIEKIEFILRNKLYKENDSYSKIYNLSFFDSLINCFLPFYENNPIIEKALENNNSTVDPDIFTKYVNKLPILDSYKYALCLSMETGNIEKKKLSKKETIEFNNQLLLSNIFNPFQNLLCEFYNFYSYYPRAKREDVFNNQMSILKTKLRTIVIDRTHELQFSANISIDEKNYTEAIIKLNDLLKIEPNNKTALWKISESYMSLKEPEYPNALRHLCELERITNSSDLEVIIEIGECYNLTKQFEKMAHYCEKAEKINPNDERVLVLRAEYFYFQDDNTNALLHYKKANSISPNDFTNTYRMGVCYDELSNLPLAIEYLTKAIGLSPKDDKEMAYCRVAVAYSNSGDVTNALKYFSLTEKIKSKDALILAEIGRFYFINKVDLELSRQYLVRSITIEKHDTTFGNLGHVELIENNEPQAIANYKECILLMNNPKEFEKKYDKDLPYILKYGISKEKYIGIKNGILDYWNSLQK